MENIVRAILVGIVFGLIITPWCAAQEKSGDERRSKPVLSNAMYRPITKAQNAMQEKDYDAAIEILDSLLAKGDRLKGYDKAKTLHLKCIAYIEQGDYAKALPVALQAIDVDALELEAQQALRYNVVNMLFVLERYQEAVQQLELWFDEIETPDAQSHFIAAQLYLSVNQMNEAIHHAEIGMGMHQANITQEANENWYRLLLSLYGQVKQYNKAATVAEQMVSLWPAEFEYYQQLTGLYQQLERMEEAWAIFDMAYQNNLFGHVDDYRRILIMHRFLGYPYRGATLFKNHASTNEVDLPEEDWELLSNAWMQARQWHEAEQTLKNAARVSTTGKHWMVLCQTTLQEERWQDALNYCEFALEKGGLKDDEADAWQLKGIAKASLKQYDDALTNFKRCAEFEETRKDCRAWVASINSQVDYLTAQKLRREQEAASDEKRRNERDKFIQRALLTPR